MKGPSRARIFQAPAKAVAEPKAGQVRCPLCTKPVTINKFGNLPGHFASYKTPCVGANYLYQMELVSA